MPHPRETPVCCHNHNFGKMLEEGIPLKPVTSATVFPSCFNIMVSPFGPVSVTWFPSRSAGNQDP